MSVEVYSLTELIGSFDCGMLLARASELARSGRLLEAEVLISEERSVRESWRGMGLLARVYVKLGKYGEALRLWHKLSKMDQSANTSEQCIQTLTTFAAAELKKRELLLIALAVAWGAAFFAILVLGILHWIK